MDLGRLIRERVSEALRRGPTNVASAVNVDTSGHTTVAYSDDEITVVQHDGETHVIRRDRTGSEGD